nr:MAG TPA: hypothetical protein [Caudoviricetes sp.]
MHYYNCYINPHTYIYMRIHLLQYIFTVIFFYTRRKCSTVKAWCFFKKIKILVDNVI